MTPKEANALVMDVWGNGRALTEKEIQALAAEALKDEVPMHTAARLAGLDVRNVAPSKHTEVRGKCTVRDLELPADPDPKATEVKLGG